MLCSWARHFTLTVPLSTQEYKWVPANCWGSLTNCWGVTCDGLASHSGGVEILVAASCYRNRDKLRQQSVLVPRLHYIAFCNIPIIIPLPNPGTIRIILHALDNTHFSKLTNLHNPLPNSQFFLRVGSHPISARKQNVPN